MNLLSFPAAEGQSGARFSQLLRILAMPLLLCAGSVWSGEPTPKLERGQLWQPSYLCLCPTTCPKPPPQLPCWCYRGTCEVYCRKPAPCLTWPCVPVCCDHYQCKPAPDCFPCGPCPPPGLGCSRLPPVGK